MRSKDYEWIKAQLIQLNRRHEKVTQQWMQENVFNYLKLNSDESASQRDSIGGIGGIGELGVIGVNIEALRSMQAQLYTRQMKYDARYDENNYSAVLEWVRTNGGDFHDGCRATSFSPYKFAKMFLEKTHRVSSSAVATFLRNTSLVEDVAIRQGLLRCVALDEFTNYENDAIRNLVGKEYEELLISLLNTCKMCFETEEQLRSKGKPKTPDIVFLIPMTVTLNGEERVVNWIDSKALFADTDTYREGLDQFNGYCNRYGRGLVIYWLGFVDTIVSTKDVGVCDRFPDSWRFPTGESADGRMPVFDVQAAGSST